MWALMPGGDNELVTSRPSGRDGERATAKRPRNGRPRRRGVRGNRRPAAGRSSEAVLHADGASGCAGYSRFLDRVGIGPAVSWRGPAVSWRGPSACSAAATRMSTFPFRMTGNVRTQPPKCRNTLRHAAPTPRAGRGPAGPAANAADAVGLLVASPSPTPGSWAETVSAPPGRAMSRGMTPKPAQCRWSDQNVLVELVCLVAPLFLVAGMRPDGLVGACRGDVTGDTPPHVVVTVETDGVQFEVCRHFVGRHREQDGPVALALKRGMPGSVLLPPEVPLPLLNGRLQATDDLYLAGLDQTRCVPQLNDRRYNILQRTLSRRHASGQFPGTAFTNVFGLSYHTVVSKSTARIAAAVGPVAASLAEAEKRP